MLQSRGPRGSAVPRRSADRCSKTRLQPLTDVAELCHAFSDFRRGTIDVHFHQDRRVGQVGHRRAAPHSSSNQRILAE